MGFRQKNDYVAWRTSVLGAEVLRDGGPDAMPERALQVVWQQQRLKDELRLGDGRRVRVLHPGFWNYEAGPDFRNAVVRIEGESTRRGDVEVDVEVGGWRAHGHHVNPNFRNVILRVVWQLPRNCRDEILPLRPHLDSPWSELKPWALNEPAGELSRRLTGRCCGPLEMMTEQERHQLLEAAGGVRLQLKADQLAARARQVGWEQALMEGLFAGLGYKRNAWPMRQIAGAMANLELPREEGSSEQLRLALMLGIAGLMPEDWPRADQRRSKYLAELWSLWWRTREAAHEHQLPLEIWQFSGVRPVNRPERRLALAAQWLAAEDLVPEIERWCEDELGGRRSVAALLQTLAQRTPSFWEDHCTFSARALNRKMPLIGKSRLTELAVNTVLPWLYARANAGRSRALADRILGAYLAWPKAEDNSILRLARQRLLGTRSGRVLKTAGQQQGLLQIVRDFCARTDSLCSDCPFPDYVKRLATPG
jgi:hypothetical protein